jgi:mRNA-degrading endonuclease RelE of RelBE toxin-antitoxin system
MSESPVTVSASLTFLRTIKRLRKKYPHIQSDVQPIIEQLLAGETPGDQIQATGYTVYKVRAPNRDAHRGKSGGYRVIYYIQSASSIVLLLIYSKSERSDTDAGEIGAIIAGLPENPE